MHNRPIEIHSYRPDWALLYQKESQALSQLLKTHIAEIHHIGSTAIKNMPAKPVIDILLECADLGNISEITTLLRGAGYGQLNKNVIPHTSFITFKETADIRFHLHIFAVGDPQVRRHVNFRDFMNQHPEDARTYAELKLHLAEKYQDNMALYVQSKSRLVQSIDARAKRWKGRRKDFLPQLPGPTADQWSKIKIMQAMEANRNVYMTHFAQYINEIELIRIPSYTLINANLGDDTFNCVIRADFPSEQAQEKIAEVSHYFKQKSEPFSWWVSDSDQPADLIACLQSEGYQYTGNRPAMYFNLDSWDEASHSEAPLRIVRAQDEQSLRDFALVLASNAAAFETCFDWISRVLTAEDPFEFYVGYLDGKPVVRGLICYYAGVAGLYALSTVSYERNKGYGALMQQFRLKRAKDMGYHIAVLEASKEGFPLYQRLGYKECGQFKEFKI